MASENSARTCGDALLRKLVLGEVRIEDAERIIGRAV